MLVFAILKLFVSVYFKNDNKISLYVLSPVHTGKKLRTTGLSLSMR